MEKKHREQPGRIRNWPEYNRALVRRGRVEVYFQDEVLEGWTSSAPEGAMGRPCLYSDQAITIALTLAAVFGLPLRAAQGFLASILALRGHQSVPVPHFTTLCRRRQKLMPSFPKRARRNKPIHVVMDSTGFKVFGEGEWKVRQHGYSKRRTWRKLHIGVDEATHEILVGELTGNDVHDGTMLPALLERIDEPIRQLSGDGAYDHRACYEALTARGIRATIPPRRDARIHRHGNTKGERLIRDENLRRIRKVGRKRWKRESGYHRRSLAETTMYRLKTIFGDHLSSRVDESQQVEALIRCLALNQMTRLGMPVRYAT